MHHEPMDSAPASSRRTAATAGAAVVLALAGSVAAIWYDQPGTATFAGSVSAALAIGAMAVVGAIVIFAVPGNRVGWLMLAAAAVTGTGAGLNDAGRHGVITGSVPGAGYLAAIGPGLRAAGMLIAVVAVPAVFPDGKLPGPRWRWLGWSTVTAVTCVFLGNVLSPSAQQGGLAHWRSPLGLPGRYGTIVDGLTAAGVLLAVASAGGAVAGLVSRWRRGGARVRQQLLFLALAACPPAFLLVAIIVANGVPPWLFGVVLLPLPVAIAVAILSHGLYDLRRAAHQGLLWLAMSGTVAAIYVLVVAGAAALVPGHQAWWPPALAAGAAALLLIPVRETLQRAVTRIVYGRWHEPYEVLADLGQRLEAAADIDRLLDAAVTELTAGLGLAGVGVRSLDGTMIAGAASVCGVDGVTIPLVAYGTAVGALTYRSPVPPLSAAGQRLVRDLARHLGGAVHAWLLRADLQRARERLVLAREEERRRLRRDLHDGIGPALAGLTLKTETARALLPPGTDGASRQLRELSEEIRRTVTDVRRVVEGLRPPALDELGLAGACTQAVDRLTAAAGVAARVEVSGELPALPAAAEVAAYRIVVEAVTNVVRHAQARCCQVGIDWSPAGLSIAVSDDGAGLAAVSRQGNGLAIMRERAEELGGTLTIADAAPGVSVQARLPVAVVPAAVASGAAATVPVGPA